MLIFGPRRYPTIPQTIMTAMATAFSDTYPDSQLSPSKATISTKLTSNLSDRRRVQKKYDAVSVHSSFFQLLATLSHFILYNRIEFWRRRTALMARKMTTRCGSPSFSKMSWSMLQLVRTSSQKKNPTGTNPQTGSCCSNTTTVGSQR